MARQFSIISNFYFFYGHHLFKHNQKNKYESTKITVYFRRKTSNIKPEFRNSPKFNFSNISSNSNSISSNEASKRLIELKQAHFAQQQQANQKLQNSWVPTLLPPFLIRTAKSKIITIFDFNSKTSFSANLKNNIKWNKLHQGERNHADQIFYPHFFIIFF